MLNFSQVKKMGIADVGEFLSRAVSPPTKQAVRAALDSLREISAVDAVSEQLTALGVHLADLPCDARLGKMMLFGVLFRCLDPVLTVAAGLGLRSPFASPINAREAANSAKASLGKALGSDHLAIVRAFEGWQNARQRGAAAEREFVSRHFLSRATLVQMGELRRQFVDLLCDIGFLPPGSREKRGGGGRGGGGRLPPPAPGGGRGGAPAWYLGGAGLNENSSRMSVVRAVIAAGLYPSVAAVAWQAPTLPPGSRGAGAGVTLGLITRTHGQVAIHPSSLCSNLATAPAGVAASKKPAVEGDDPGAGADAAQLGLAQAVAQGVGTSPGARALGASGGGPPRALAPQWMPTHWRYAVRRASLAAALRSGPLSHLRASVRLQRELPVLLLLAMMMNHV